MAGQPRTGPSSTARNKTPMRWVIVLASALATVGFFIPIVNGPQPSNLSATASVSFAAPVVQAASNVSSAPVSMSRVRLRTRGS